MSHYYPMMGDYYFGWHLGMSLVWLIFLIVVAYLIYKLIKHEKILTPSRPVVKSAEDILLCKERGDQRAVHADERRLEKVQLKFILRAFYRPA